MSKDPKIHLPSVRFSFVDNPDEEAVEEFLAAWEKIADHTRFTILRSDLTERSGRIVLRLLNWFGLYTRSQVWRLRADARFEGAAEAALGLSRCSDAGKGYPVIEVTKE